ncbi:MAG: nuclear transport factor 2 family protein [Bacteroidota bacterium]
MKILSAFFCVMVLLLTSCEQKTYNTTSEGSSQNASQQEQEIKNLLNEWTTAITQQDAEALNRLAADEHFFTGFDGTMLTKQDNIASLTNPMFHIGAIETQDVKVHTYADAAVITGKANLTMTAESGSSKSSTRFTQTWIRNNGVWQLVAEHTSNLPLVTK